MPEQLVRMTPKPPSRWKYCLRELAWLAAVGVVAYGAAKLANHNRDRQALKATTAECADGSEPLITKGLGESGFTIHCP